MFSNALLMTDGYKLDHRRQYPEGTEYVYSNWTPRSNKFMPEAKDGAVVFGIQYFIKKFLIEKFNKEFFELDEDEAANMYTRRVNALLGPNKIGSDHVRALHRLGYLPIRLKALPEGSVCPIRVPMITVVNTKPEFFWITNFLETIMSCELWLPMTSATKARAYRKRLNEHAQKAGFADQGGLGFLCHDFSMRGMCGLEASIISGLGHLTSFTGSETIPAIGAAEEYYNIDAEKELICGTVPASEHSVMCAGGKIDEFGTFKRFITELYPDGFVSIVSDTWDLWKVVTDYLPRLKDEIMSRNGRVVIRPDSGDPVEILCGIPDKDIITVGGVHYHIPEIARGIFDELYTVEDYIKTIKQNPEKFAKDIVSEAEIKGVYEILWDTFGGSVNDKGFKVLDSHIGALYGDSITLDRQNDIYNRLEEKGFAATNLVLGIGLAVSLN